MPRRKIPGVYMIRNINNGKVYIGQSKDIVLRFSRHRWAAETETGKYSGTKRTIAKVLRNEGIDNFEFLILFQGPEYNDVYTRLAKEAECIMQYRAYDPEYGYNETLGQEPVCIIDISRKQSVTERAQRAKAIIEYDTQTGSMMLYMGGAKAWGKDRGYDKDVSSHAVKRGCLVENRYYLIYADKTLRDEQLKKIASKKLKTENRRLNVISRSTNSFNAYKAVVEIVDKEW